jgi:hypothetical protein
MVESSNLPTEVIFSEITTVQFEAMVDWMERSNLSCVKYHTKFYDASNDLKTGVFIFTNEKEAMMFKIRWMSEV